MADVKNFGIKGIGDDVQLGKRGPRVIVSGSTVQFRNAANSAYENVEFLDPTAPDHGATKRYVDAVASGLDLKASVVAATTGALPAVTYNNGTAGLGATLTANANGAIPAQDGVTLVLNDRLLVKDQATQLENGIYELTQIGDAGTPFILTRTTDFDENPNSQGFDEITDGAFTFVEQGTVNAGKGYVQITDDPITIGTTSIVWTQFSDTGSQDPKYRQESWTFSDTGANNFSVALPSNAIVQRVKLNIDTIWDADADIEVQSSSPQTFMAASENDVLLAETFISDLFNSTQIGANTLQTVITDIGAPTQGDVTVHVEYVLG